MKRALTRKPGRSKADPKVALMRIRFLGDHSSYHCGSSAVTNVIMRELRKIGRLVEDQEDHDLLVVNGEGSMHHASAAFHLKIGYIADAQRRGCKTWLINSVWDQNPNVYDGILKNLDGFHVRGIESYKDLIFRHGITSTRGIDFSFFEDIDSNTIISDYQNSVVYTDAYAKSFGSFVWPSNVPSEWIPIDMRDFTWSTLVRSLKTARILITGRHHAMYAACKAGIPFVPIAGNTHKFEDLLNSAECPVPVCRSWSEVSHVLSWAERNKPIYDKLYDWMKSQPIWSVDKIEPPFRVEREPVGQAFSSVARARMAGIRQAHIEAAEHWATALNSSPNNTNIAIYHASALMRAGRVAQGASLLVQLRIDKPEASERVQHEFAVVAIRDAAWTRLKELTPNCWWPELQRLAYRSLVEREDITDPAAALISNIAQREGIVSASAARLLLIRRLMTQRMRQALSVLRAAAINDLPQWTTDLDHIALLIRARSYDPIALQIIDRIKASPAISSTNINATLIEYQWERSGPTLELRMEAQSNLSKHPADNRSIEITALIALDAGDRTSAEKIVSDNLEHISDNLASSPALCSLASRSMQVSIMKPAELNMVGLYDSLITYTNSFYEILRDRSKSIAVVGNSPCELGRMRGYEIDNHDFVVRFNAFSMSGDYANDYGHKTDIVVTVKSIDYFKTAYLEKLSKDVLYIFAFPRWIYVNKDWGPILDAVKAGYKVGFIPQSEKRQIGATYGITPSNGLTILSMIRKYRILRSRDVYGFSFIDQLQSGVSAHYFESARASDLHDWLEEARILGEWLQE